MIGWVKKYVYKAPYGGGGFKLIHDLSKSAGGVGYQILLIFSLCALCETMLSL